MAGERNRLAEQHADRASALLAGIDMRRVLRVQQEEEPFTVPPFTVPEDWQALDAHDAAMATAHALTALALRKVGGR